jgi:glycosyltransferase involved in cell wall biosynthesis
MSVMQLRQNVPHGRRPRGRVLLVVPAFNEERSIVSVVQTAHNLGYDVCVVDDCSYDHTAERGADAGAYVLRLPKHLGVGAALRGGFRWALDREFDTVVQIDANGRHDPRQVEALLDVLDATKADMVIGSPIAAGSNSVGGIRQLAMKILSARIKRVTGARVLDPISGFRVIRRPLLDQFADKYRSEYHTVAALIEAGRVGAKIIDHPVLTALDGGSASPKVGLWYVLRAIIVTELFLPKGRLAPLPKLRPVAPK